MHRRRRKFLAAGAARMRPGRPALVFAAAGRSRRAGRRPCSRSGRSLARLSAPAAARARAHRLLMLRVRQPAARPPGRPFGGGGARRARAAVPHTVGRRVAGAAGHCHHVARAHGLAGGPISLLAAAVPGRDEGVHARAGLGARARAAHVHQPRAAGPWARPRCSRGAVRFGQTPRPLPPRPRARIRGAAELSLTLGTRRRRRRRRL